MAAPKGSYTPRSGPLAGRTFDLRPGDAPTAPYNRYQNALAHALGFRGYSAERKAIQSSSFRMLENRLRSQGQTRYQARSRVQSFSPRGESRHNIIAWAVREGLYDTGDEAAYELYGSQ